MGLFIMQGDSEFESQIRPVDGEWEGWIIERNINRLVPTLHLRHSWTSLEAALAGVQRRWQRLFPESTGSAAVDFRAAVMETDSVTEPVRHTAGAAYPDTAC